MKHLKEQDALSKDELALLRNCKRAVGRVEPYAQVVLYGSRARGDAGGESDYDLLVIAGGKATLEREDRIRKELYPIELESGSVLTVILLSQESWESSLYRAMPFCQNALKEGVVL